MTITPDADFGRVVIPLLTDALSALLNGVNKLSEGNARWIDLHSLEYLIEDARGQALAALKSGVAYCAIPILKPGDQFALGTDEKDLDEEGQERITPAGSIWIVQELEPEFDPLMQYAVHCPQTGGSIHITHAELAECGYSAGGNRKMAEDRILVLRVPGCFDADNKTVFDALDQGADLLGCYPISTFNSGRQFISPVDPVLNVFMKTTGADLEDALKDLLCNLMHWCDHNKLVFENELGTAMAHYKAEKLET